MGGGRGGGTSVMEVMTTPEEEAGGGEEVGVVGPRASGLAEQTVIYIKSGPANGTFLR